MPFSSLGRPGLYFLLDICYLLERFPFTLVHGNRSKPLLGRIFRVAK